MPKLPADVKRPRRDRMLSVRITEEALAWIVSESRRRDESQATIIMRMIARERGTSGPRARR